MQHYRQVVVVQIDVNSLHEPLVALVSLQGPNLIAIAARYLQINAQCVYGLTVHLIEELYAYVADVIQRLCREPARQS